MLRGLPCDAAPEPIVPGTGTKPPLLDHMPPAFAHCCSGEGSEPGCEIIAQPARVDSTHSRASPVAAILRIQLARRRIAW
jgi:hypothetical protein